MTGKDREQEPNVDEYEFYLAEDMGDLDLEVDPDDATPDRPPSRELSKRIAKSHAEAAAKKAAAAKAMPTLADRGRPPQKKMTALEALAAIKLREVEEEEAKKAMIEAQLQAAAQKEKARLAKRLARDAALKVEAKRLQDEKREADDEAEWARAAFGSSHGPQTVVAGAKSMAAAPRVSASNAAIVVGELAQGAQVLATYDDIPAGLVGPLFLSHQLRAQHDGDLAAVQSFSAIRAAVEHRLEDLSAARVSFGGEEWAVWIDGDAVIAALRPADLYLVGL